MKILTVVGARPQFIKAATVSRAINQHNDRNQSAKIREVLVHTGQHFDSNMSNVFFEQLDIPRPNHNLGISSLDHGAMTGRMLEGLEALIKQERPSWLLVYGDTNSTLAGALAAAKLHVPVAHVEAGLRSHNPAMPEEINRVLTDRVSSLLFCPTTTAMDNLDAEGFPYPIPDKRNQQYVNVGDVMYDATLYYRDKAYKSAFLEEQGLKENEYCLCTLHRVENTENTARLENILAALRYISQQRPVVLPLHPRTRNLVEKCGGQEWLQGITILNPVPYLEMQCLEMGAHTILTDSGGIQKEAFFHRVPCITLRDETEWVETVEMGWNYVVGSDKDRIMSVYNMLQVPTSIAGEPYGDGTAAQQIAQLIWRNR